MSRTPHQDETSVDQDFIDQTSDADPTCDGPRPSGDPSSDHQDQAHIDELLDAWEATCEAGDPVPVETLCQDRPDLVPQIRERVAALQAVDQKLANRKKQHGKTLPQLQIETLVKDMQFLNAGGLGEVFVGEDNHLHRRVAIKFMHTHLCEKAERRGQFALEAEITGRLEHPGIVPLYGFGCTEDNRPFYAMRFIDGETLDDAIKRYFRSLEAADDKKSAKSQEANATCELALEFRRLLGSFVSVCKTIAYAHNRGVVHRDIKPSNIMIGRFGETMVVDWGLAVPVMRDERFRSSGEETLALSPSGSQSGSSGRGSGTPAFMSPEQFSELAPTPANDIYSLGATLFVMLCGKPPIRHKSISEIRNDTIEGKLPDLTEFRKDVPKQLQAIAYKAMQKEAKDRYPTALELARDVERYLGDEPVSAYQDSLGLRVARVARRHRSAAQAAVLGLVACLLIAGVSALWMRNSANFSERLRDRNLATSSQFMARSIGQDVDRIWRVLEFEANQPRLQQLVTESNSRLANGDIISVQSEAALQNWLEQRLTEYESLHTVNAMFVLSQDGTQVARAPLPAEPQVGENFAFRDYYTGLGYDLTKGARSILKEPLTGPIVHPSNVHMSVAYLSTLTNEQVLKVTFTVPVWDVQHEHRIGLIGTSISIGDIMPKITDKSTAWLVDLRDDHLENNLRQRGLLLQHPDLEKQDLSHVAPRLPSELLDRIHSQLNDTNGLRQIAPIMEIADPLNQSPVYASVSPITIDGRGSESLNLNWIVVAAEPGAE